MKFELNQALFRKDGLVVAIKKILALDQLIID